MLGSLPSPLWGDLRGSAVGLQPLGWAGTAPQPAAYRVPLEHTVQRKRVSWGFYLFLSTVIPERLQNSPSTFPAQFQ